MPEIPPHRHFITSLITNLTSITPETQPENEETHHLPSSSRPLLLTLHVIFPTLLLPALDLLDRRLVTRLAVHETSEEKTEVLAETYVVKSLATTITRRHRESAPTAPKKSYVVSLRAWNCSCASFAFDAFPIKAEASGTISHEGWSNEGSEAHDFGGLSVDGLVGMGEDVPCCKHLLACLLADQWGEQMGPHVERKEVSRDEYAGVVAGL